MYIAEKDFIYICTARIAEWLRTDNADTVGVFGLMFDAT